MNRIIALLVLSTSLSITAMDLPCASTQTCFTILPINVLAIIMTDDITLQNSVKTIRSFITSYKLLNEYINSASNITYLIGRLSARYGTSHEYVARALKTVYAQQYLGNQKAFLNTCSRLFSPHTKSDPAIRTGLNTLQQWVKEGADITFVNEQGVTPLRALFIPFKNSFNGDLVLKTAAAKKYLKSMTTLVDWFTRQRVQDILQPSEEIKYVYVAVQLSVKAHDNSLITALRDIGLSSAVINQCEQVGTPLHYAAGKGTSSLVRLLLDAGAQPNKKSLLCLTPREWAAGYLQDACNKPHAKNQRTIQRLQENIALLQRAEENYQTRPKIE